MAGVCALRIIILLLHAAQHSTDPPGRTEPTRLLLVADMNDVSAELTSVHLTVRAARHGTEAQGRSSRRGGAGRGQYEDAAAQINWRSNTLSDSPFAHSAISGIE